jgi:hypothetical protein
LWDGFPVERGGGGAARGSGQLPIVGGTLSEVRRPGQHHAAAAAARDQASAPENAAVYAAIRKLLASGAEVGATPALPAALTGAWRGVAAVLWRIPRPEWDAALVMVCRMLETIVTDRDSEVDDRSAVRITASVEPGTPGAGLSPMSA